MDYTQYSDKFIRNKDNPTTEENSLADLQASEEVANFLNRFSKEPKFLKRVASKLTDRLGSRLEDPE